MSWGAGFFTSSPAPCCDTTLILVGRTQASEPPCFAAVLNGHLRGRQWLIGTDLTIADFSVGAWLAVTKPFQLPVTQYTEILRWYDGLASLPGWQASLVPPPA